MPKTSYQQSGSNWASSVAHQLHLTSFSLSGTVFTTATICPCPEPDQSCPCSPPHPVSVGFILISTSHICLGFPRGIFPSGFAIKTMYAPLLFPVCAICLTHLIPLIDHPSDIWRGVQIMKLLIMQFPLVPCYLILVRPKYLPHYPILKHFHPFFLPLYMRPSFTPTENKGEIRVPNILIFMFLGSK